MAIQKQEFYEGAALHALARSGQVETLTYEPPFFTINRRLTVLIKYCTKGRSPWSFTFVPDEQKQLHRAASRSPVVVGLVCGADGVAAFGHSDFLKIADPKGVALHVACFRTHGKHYKVKGPEGILDRRVPPSDWRRVLELEWGDAR